MAGSRGGPAKPWIPGTALWAGLFGPWSTGAAVLAIDRRLEPDERAELLERFQPTIAVHSPARHEAFLDELEERDIRLTGLRNAASTGARLSPALARRFRERYPRLDVLVNNAGGIWLKRQLTVDGREMTFAVNHLAYFLLTHLLLDLLKASAPARSRYVANCTGQKPTTQTQISAFPAKARAQASDTTRFTRRNIGCCQSAFGTRVRAYARENGARTTTERAANDAKEA